MPSTTSFDSSDLATPFEDDFMSNNPWAVSSSSSLTIIDADTPWYMSPKTSLDSILVFLCILAFCSGIIGNLLCIVAFCFRRRSCLTVDVGLIAIYIAVMFLLVRSLSSFHLQFMVSSHSQYSDYQANKVMVCILPYCYAAVHMAVFYMLTLISALQYLNITWPQYSLRPRHIFGFVVVIAVFSFLVNIHFLLVHCRAFEYQLYIEYVKTVWLKFVFVDGSAFILAFFFLVRTLIAIRSASEHLPDRHLLRDDCLAVMLVLFTYATPVFVDSLFALIELYSSDDRLSLRTVHFDLVLTLHVISLASIPIITATTRPATRLDVNGLFDRWREAIDNTCFPRRTADEIGNNIGVGFVQRLRIMVSGGHANGASAILGEAGDGPTDDRLEILSVSPCHDDDNNNAVANNSPIAPPPSYNQLTNASLSSNSNSNVTSPAVTVASPVLGGFAVFNSSHGYHDNVDGAINR